MKFAVQIFEKIQMILRMMNQEHFKQLYTEIEKLKLYCIEIKMLNKQSMLFHFGFKKK